MSLTKRRALELTRDLWTWMRDTGATSFEAKADWPGWKDVVDLNVSFYCHCPCCAYTKFSCRECPLYDLWGIPREGFGAGVRWATEEEYKDYSSPCVDGDGSPYLPFALRAGTPEQAQRIVDGCNASLATLED